MLDPKIMKKLKKQLINIVGADNVLVQETDRVLNAHDAWPLSEAKLRAGEMLPLADLVIFPSSSEEVSRILTIANEMEIPVTPVGGGAGTCGGTLPIYDSSCAGWNSWN
jgi:FAD/FMN-containing dehydrogenase